MVAIHEDVGEVRVHRVHYPRGRRWELDRDALHCLAPEASRVGHAITRRAGAEYPFALDAGQGRRMERQGELHDGRARAIDIGRVDERSGRMAERVSHVRRRREAALAEVLDNAALIEGDRPETLGRREGHDGGLAVYLDGLVLVGEFAD